MRDVLQAFLLYKGFVFLKTQITDLVKTLIDLERGVALVQTQLNNLGKDFRQNITKEIVNIGKETGVSLDSLAKAEFNIVSANIKVERSFDILRLAAKAAVAGGIGEIDTAFQAALTQVNAFGLGIHKFNRVFDLQFNLVKRGIFTYEQMANVVGEVSIAFAGFGQDIETANAALAAVSQVFTGPQLAEGATGLKNAALQIRENVERFEDFGIAVTDARGNFRDLISILRDMDTVLGNLSEAERARVLQELFQEKRAIRGVSVLLTQLDQLEEFYIEQKLALGDLDQAFSTMNETMIQQARIFKAELVPAMEPFVRMISGVLEKLNGINDVMPGFTRNLVTFGTVAAALGSISLLGGRFGATMGQPLSAGVIAPTMMGLSATRMPKALGVAGLGLGALSAYEVGKSAGFSGTGLLGAAGTGALAGGLAFGPAGAALGGILNSTVFMLGDAMREQAKPVAKSFSEAFASALKENSGDVASAFAIALGAATTGTGIGIGLIGRAVRHTGTTTRVFSREETLQGLMAAGGTNTPFAKGGLSAGLAINELFGNKRRGSEEVSIPGVDAAFAAISKQVSEFDRMAESMRGLGMEQEIQIARTALINNALSDQGEWFKGQDEYTEAQRSMTALLIDQKLTVEQATQALHILAKSKGDLKPFGEFLRSVKSATGGVTDAFSILATRFNGLASGSFTQAAMVFARLGNEGMRLAAVFAQMNGLMQSFAILQTLRETKITRLINEPYTKTLTAREAVAQFGGTGFMGLMPRLPQGWVRDPKTGNVSFSGTKTVEKQESILEALGINENRIGEGLIAELRASMLNIQGSGDLTEALATLLTKTMPQEAIAEMFPQIVTPIQEVIEKIVTPGATSLGEQLREAADLVRGGLINPIGYTADGLEMFAEELDFFNKQVFKIGIIEEISRLGEFAGFGKDALRPAIETLIKNIKLGGLSFQQAFTDPTRLAELLASIEFGDVTVDNSTQNHNNFVIRISEGVSGDPENLSKIADGIMKELNNRTRKALA